MLGPLLLLLGGLAAIAVGAQLAVGSAIRLARHHGLSDLFVGSAVLALGSDLPEIVVSLNAAVRMLGGVDTSSLIVGNALGSCFGQLGLTLAIAGLFSPLALPRRDVLVQGGALMVAMAALAVLASDGSVSALDGVLLCAAFAAYLVILSRAERFLHEVPGEPPVSRSRPWLRLAAGLALVGLSAELIVSAAMDLAALWRVPPSLVAIVFVGAGTSLPELSIALAALARRRAVMGVGNLFGSNVVDLLLPAGLAALVHPVAFAPGLLHFDLAGLVLLTVVVLLFFWRRRFARAEAGVVLVLYLAYIGAKIAGAGGA
ncbi:MAG: sodium:calcium antiporter [Gammaproteobacteria bacterium]